jgi:hypothetical protein
VVSEDSVAEQVVVEVQPEGGKKPIFFATFIVQCTIISEKGELRLNALG